LKIINENNLSNKKPNSKITIDSSQKLTTNKQLNNRMSLEDNKDITNQTNQKVKPKNLFKSSKELSSLVGNETKSNMQNFLKSMTIKGPNTFRGTKFKAKTNKLLMDEKFVDKLKVYGINQIENDNELKQKFFTCGIVDMKTFIQEFFDDKIFMYKLDLVMTDTTFNKQKKEKFFKTEIKKALDEILLEQKQIAIFNKLDENLNRHFESISNFDFHS